MMFEVLAILALAAAAWLLWDSLRAREAANAAMRAACRAEGLLFLDDTVALDAIRPVRNDAGHVVLRRVYGFEYSDTGTNRRRGRLTMTGSRIDDVWLGPRPVDGAGGAA